MRRRSYIEMLILNQLHYVEIASSDLPEKLCRHDLMESLAACLQTHQRFALIYHCELDCEHHTLSMNYEDEIYLELRCEPFPNSPLDWKMQICNKWQIFIGVSSKPSASLTLLTLALDYRSLESVYLKPQDWHKELSASFYVFLCQNSNNQI